jgi:hypothetical protein
MFASSTRRDEGYPSGGAEFSVLALQSLQPFTLARRQVARMPLRQQLEYAQ